MPKIEKLSEIAAHVRFETSPSDYAHVKVSFMEAATGYGIGHKHPLNDLVISCQMTPDMSKEERPTYGWHVRYTDAYFIDEDDARRMYDLLHWLNGRLDKLIERDGYCNTFGQYVVRVLRTIGVRTARVDGYDPADPRWFEDGRYGEMASAIDYRCRDKVLNWHTAGGWVKGRF